METNSLKAISIAVLQGNRQGNQKETLRLHRETSMGNGCAPALHPFDLSHWQAEITKLVDERSSKDPGGDCWQWMKDNRPELWKDHLAADMAIDEAYQEQNAEKIGAAISKARSTFSAMIEGWNNSGELSGGRL